MRWLVLLCLVPCAAQATDLHITVEYVMTQERVRPDPKTVYPHMTRHFILHEGGGIDETSLVRGAHPDANEGSTRLGKDRFRVVNAQTITRSWSTGAQKRTLTVTTNGTGCKATLSISGANEFTAPSVDHGVPGVYRNAQLQSISCKIE